MDEADGRAQVRSMHVEVLAPEAVRWSGAAVHVVVPGVEGRLGILPGRQPVMTVLVPGEVRIRTHDGAWHVVPIGGGFVTVGDGSVEVLDC